MLLGNFTVLNKNPGRMFGGTTVCETRAQYGKSGSRKNMFVPVDGAGVSSYSAIPSGYYPPYTIQMAIVAGEMASRNITQGTGSVSNANMGGAVDISASIFGVGDFINADMGLIVSAVATILGSGTITQANMNAVANMQATIQGSGSLTVASIEAIGNMVSTILGSGTVTQAQMNALGNMVATIQIGEQGTLTPEGLARSLWNSVAAEYVTPGTMGKKLNDAGSSATGISPQEVRDAMTLAPTLTPEVGSIDQKIQGATNAGLI